MLTTPSHIVSEILSEFFTTSLSHMTHFLLDELMNTFIYLLGPRGFLSGSPQRKTFVL